MQRKRMRPRQTLNLAIGKCEIEIQYAKINKKYLQIRNIYNKERVQSNLKVFKMHKK